MSYLTGFYENFVDEKGRVIMPKKLKEQMGSELVFTRGLDDCVYVLTREAWAALEEKLAKLPISKGRGVSHFFNTYKSDVTADKQVHYIIANLQHTFIQPCFYIEYAGEIVCICLNLVVNNTPCASDCGKVHITYCHVGLAVECQFVAC